MSTLDSDRFDLVRAFMEERCPFNRLLGVRITAIEPGFVRYELPFRDDLIGDPDRRAIHGGVLSAVLDACGGTAAFTLVDFPTDRVSTIDLRVDYLRPGAPKPLITEARVTRMGNRVASVDGACFHPDAPEELIATGKGVYSVYRGQRR